mmetsp:Transcript_1869/g.3774  ORF Transcript_1869/g.3774 Transcript_1869/m.3774 type:complete len:625 (-) Transcript_1869:104-1978(-)
MFAREDLRSELDELQRRIKADVAEMLVPVLTALEHLALSDSKGFAPSMASLQSTASEASFDNQELVVRSPHRDMTLWPPIMKGIAPPGVVAPCVCDQFMSNDDEPYKFTPVMTMVELDASKENPKYPKLKNEPQNATGLIMSDDVVVFRQASEKSKQSVRSTPKKPAGNAAELSICSSEAAFVRQTSTRKNSKQSVRSTHSRTPNKRISSASTKRRLSTSSLDSIATTSTDGHSLQRRILNVVTNSSFDFAVGGLIIMNGIFVGIQTDFLTRRLEEDPHVAFQVAEYIFSVLFTVELALRLFAFRCSFFTNQQRWWNTFDSIIVSLQLFEIFMFVVASNAGVGFSFNFLRILRLVRVVRLARALRVISELRTIVSSIAGSVKPLFWTGVLLCLIAYVFGVALTQLVHMKILEMLEKNEPIPERIERYWGSLSVTIFTLIQAITGGINWDEACRPLMETIGVELGLLFTVYILFCSLAMLNVVTGVFIEAVMENGRRAKEQCTKQHVQNLFTALNISHDGTILWREFESYLDSQEMQDFFSIVDVDISNAKRLFELLDTDNSGSIDAAELMDGCLRLWTPAKDLDMRMVSHDVCRLRHRITELVKLVKCLQRASNSSVADKLLGG